MRWLAAEEKRREEERREEEIRVEKRSESVGLEWIWTSAMAD